jgi:hypothetical protein
VTDLDALMWEEVKAALVSSPRFAEMYAAAGLHEGLPGSARGSELRTIGGAGALAALSSRPHSAQSAAGVLSRRLRFSLSSTMP